jgi:hypothetical protein
MSMSKKDYEVIGAILRANYNQARDAMRLQSEAQSTAALNMLDSIVDSMADAFKRDNVRFQKGLFLDAATPSWHREARGLSQMKRSVTRVHAHRPQPEGF